MSLSVNTNLSAIQAYNNLNATSNQMQTTINQLSSGLQIQTAADNAAGYVISQGLQTQANGLGVAINNGQDAISVLQIASGAMNQQISILQTMNQLATQAANGGANNSNSLSADQQEFAALQSQLDQIANSTSFGGTNLLNGSYSNEVFQIGAYASSVDQVSVTIATLNTTSLGIASSTVSIGTVSAAISAMAAVQSAILAVASAEAVVGAAQNQVQAIIANDTVAQQNVQSANSTLVDTNMAQAMTAFSSQQVLMQAGVAMLSQAQALPQLILKLLP
ncbi:flagellin domain protein [Acidimicrobium ferrooxidans DSM 10331]|uniref:Flagellin n=1 Tax=Acidimicrobium ferrooxidans (strain DSM 10331 / JCM 15462 / NBRC 103882 / ICP) TaxID=525909 RepID=C7M1N4_ACIFD|nr:flagellin [Acidimicrobium ferrooxidans]ACU53083.1 flagellin domain protein [Acidimicrobium ferrooxidans DSM 10331]